MAAFASCAALSPSEARAAELAAADSFIDHASATIADARMDQAVAAAPAPVAEAVPPAADDHSLATIASNLIDSVTSFFTGAKTRLASMVDTYGGVAAGDAEQECLAGAVYFEARGEPLEGQLAVAEVVMNRAASGRYPPSLCAVVKQAAQFSFVGRGGRFPPIKRDSEAWRRAVAIARIANLKLATEVAPNVLWYHADYVAPSWGRRLTRVAKIGGHLFYS